MTRESDWYPFENWQELGPNLPERLAAIWSSCGQRQKSLISSAGQTPSWVCHSLILLGSLHPRPNAERRLQN